MEDSRAQKNDKGLIDLPSLLKIYLSSIAQIESIRVTHIFKPEVETKAALGELLRSVRKPFSEDHPDAEILCWYVFQYNFVD